MYWKVLKKKKKRQTRKNTFFSPDWTVLILSADLHLHNSVCYSSLTGVNMNTANNSKHVIYSTLQDMGCQFRCPRHIWSTINWCFWTNLSYSTVSTVASGEDHGRRAAEFRQGRGLPSIMKSNPEHHASGSGKESIYKLCRKENAKLKYCTQECLRK